MYDQKVETYNAILALLKFTFITLPKANKFKKCIIFYQLTQHR